MPNPFNFGNLRKKRFLMILAAFCLLYILISKYNSMLPGKYLFRKVSTTALTIQSPDELLPLQKNYFDGFGKQTIPKIVHITYKSTDLPVQYESYLRNCTILNPDVTFLFWTDSQAEKIVKHYSERSKDKEDQRLYHILTTYQGVEKADVLRLMLLHFIGGIYMDLDTECKISFTEIHRILDQKMRIMHNGTSAGDDIGCLLDQEQWLQTRVHWWRQYCAMNNFMICRPNHAFFRYMLINLKEDDKKTFIMDKTGPFLLTKRYEEYNDLLQRGSQSPHWKKENEQIFSKAKSNKVVLAHPDWFSTLVDELNNYEQQCRKFNNGHGWFREGCTTDMTRYKKTVDENVRSAYLIHRFLHLAYTYNHHLIKQNFSIYSVPGIHIMSLK